MKTKRRVIKYSIMLVLLAAWLSWDLYQARTESQGVYRTFLDASLVNLKSPAATTVAVVRSNDASLANPVDVTTDGIPYATVEQMVRRAVDLAGGFRGMIRSGDTVLIKPNIVQGDSSGSGGVTDVRVVKAVVRMVDEIDHGNILIIVGDGSPRPFTTFEKKSGTTQAAWAQLFDVPGYQALKTESVAAGIRFRLSNLNGNSDTDPWPELDSVSVPSGSQAQPQGGAYFVHKDVTRASVYITVPVLKIHEQPGITCALKNQIGLAASTRYGFNKTTGVTQENRLHKLLHQAQLPYNWQDKEIVDLASIARIRFAVVDAITCLETQKTPAYNALDRSNRKISNRIVMNTIVAGADPVAVDNVCCRIIGLNPDDIEHITLAERVGLGTNNPDSITVAGSSIEQTRRRFRKSEQPWAIYGQSNRIWTLNGPYPASDPGAMNTEFIPSEASARPTPGQNGWSAATYFTDDQIMLKDFFKSSLGAADKVVSYAFTYVYVQTGQQAELWVGSDEAMRVYVNGQMVYNFSGQRTFSGADYYKDTSTVLQLRQGLNTLLVKLYQSTGAYNFSLNLCELSDKTALPVYRGNRVQGLKFLMDPSLVTGVATSEISRIQNCNLSDCYPNPFNPVTVVRYQLNKMDHVKLTVYDLLGREVAVLVDEVKSEGTYEARWDASHVSSGVYFCHMQTGTYEKTKRMVCLK